MYSRRDFLEGSLAAGAVFVAGAQGSAAATDDELTGLTLREASRLVQSKSVSSVDLTRACLARIDRLNPGLAAFITVTGDRALARARDLDRELKQGRWRGPLHGIPVAVKDNIDTAGIRTTAASAVYADRVPTEDAEVVRRLYAAGAVLVGKLNLHEFAYGNTATTSHYGAVRNPWNRDYIAGGSSGGSGAAVAAGLCYAAIGTETGVSIRLPAALCGVVGLKPTYGLVSARGVIPVSWSYDHVGPLCRTVGDAALVLNAIAGYDPEDGGSIEAPSVDYAKHLDAATSSFRLGRQKRTYYENVDPQVAAAVDRALKVLEGLTSGSVREVSLPETVSFVVNAEAHAYHAPLLARTPERYHPTTRANLQSAGKVTTADYAKGRRGLDRIRNVIGRVFTDVDLLVRPTSPKAALKVAEAMGPFDMPENSEDTSGYGIPAITVPCGFTDAGLPIGLQISGPRLGEQKVLALAHAYERATQWHTRRPRL